MSLVENTRKLYTVNNLHSITGIAKPLEREIIQKIDSTTPCAF